jgi:hypothetical protein
VSEGNLRVGHCRFDLWCKSRALEQSSFVIMLAISESIKKRTQAATERTETAKKARLEPGKVTLATCESFSQRIPKVLCLFCLYDEDSKDQPRLRSAEEKYAYEAHTISLTDTVTHSRHLTGDITTGFGLCLATVRNWNDSTFDMIAFDWHNMPSVYYREHAPSKDVFAFLLGAPGFLNSRGVVDIPCTPHFYEGHLAEKGSIEEIFDITFLREHELAEKCFLSEVVGNEGLQHTKYCKLTLKQLKAHTDNKVVLKAYDKMIKDHCHDGVEDICMIRLTVKPNLEALPPTEGLRPHEKVLGEKKKQAMKVPENGEPLFCRKGPKTRNEERRLLAAQIRPVCVAEKKHQAEELNPTVDPSPTTRTQKHSSSSFEAAANTRAAPTTATTTAAATTVAVITATRAPTVVLLANVKDLESGGGGGVFGAAAQGGTLEATWGHAGSSYTGLQLQVQGPRVVAKKKTKQAEKCKSAKFQTIADLMPEVLRSDVATVEGMQTSAPSSNKRANDSAPHIVSTTCIVDEAARKATTPDVSEGLPPTVAGNDDANVVTVSGSNMSGTFRRKAAKRTEPCYRALSPQNLAAPLPPSPQDEDIQETKRPRLENPYENTSHATTLAPPAAAHADSVPVMNTQLNTRTARTAGVPRRWTPEEDAKLTSAITDTFKKKWGKEYKNDWVAIAARVPGRTKVQCSSRWRDALDPSIGSTTARAGSWTEDEDKMLKDAVRAHDGKNWAAIAALVLGRTKKQCISRWHDTLVSKIDPTTARTGTWTAAEDKMLKDAVLAHGGKNWGAIAARVPGRTKVQCTGRWRDALDPSIGSTTARAGSWTEDEDKMLKDAVPTHGGKHWGAIAELVPGRTKVQCRNRWRKGVASKV